MGNSNNGDAAAANHTAAVMGRIGLTARPAYKIRICRKWAGENDKIGQRSTNG
jgi:hypothetical protein